ncbi:hypothetical protein TNCV_3891871 [Trichonephila clavipes]|nr:hypothetical protein TNCV_3891871 [Trichonephila clavipes]
MNENLLTSQSNPRDNGDGPSNRRAPLTSTDSGSLRSCTRRRYHPQDRSHYINTTTNQEAPSRNAGESSQSQVIVDELDGVPRPVGL